MEALIKKYFWTTNLLFVAVAAWLLSNAINAVITLKMRAIPSMTQNVEKARPASGPKLPAEDNQVILDRNYFGSAMALKVNSSANGPALNESDAEKLMRNGQQSSLRATLVGTIVASDARWSMAVMTDQNSSQTNIYRVGDPFMGEAAISGIYSQRVYVLRNGVHEYLELQEKGKGVKIAAAHAVASAMPQADGGSDTVNVRQLGTDRYAIDRSEIDKTLTNLNTIAMQARIVPSFVNGEADGFKLFAIRPGSLYSKMGIENGDVIQKINGFPMNSPDKALEVYQKLKTANSIEVEITRQGQKRKMTYQIN